MKRELLTVIIAVLLLANTCQLAWSLFAHRLPWDAVPTEDAALKVGMELLESVYGEGVCERFSPIRIEYDEKRKAWIVCGTLSEDKVGGTPGIVFRKRDGKILKIDNSM